MWKIFVMGPFSISLTFSVLLKNQKKKKKLPAGFQSTYCHL